MTDINKLFGNTNTTAPEITGEDALKQLVGEGAKYATAEDLAKAMVHGQFHIQTIENENATLRSSTEAAKSIEDVLAAIRGTTTQEPHPATTVQVGQGASDTLSVAEQIAAAFAARDTQTQSQKEQSNREMVITELGKTYGNEASQLYSKVGSDLGINLDELAGKSPAAVLKLVADARPVHTATQQSNLPAGTHVQHAQLQQGGVLNQTAINALYASGKIKLREKHELENNQLTLLGRDAFYR